VKKDIEIWHSIKDSLGYSISSNGRVMRTKTGRELSPQKNRAGYHVVSIYYKEKRKTEYIHRLVASSFIRKNSEKLHVNHINGNKDDNRVVNLEWITQKENNAHANENGLNDNSGDKNGMSKISDSDVVAIRNLYLNGVSPKLLSNAYGINYSYCCQVCIGERYKI